MITEAYIAGDIGKAVFKEGGGYFILDCRHETGKPPQPLSEFDLNNFTLVWPEINAYKEINWSRDRLHEQLSEEANQMKALSLFLMGMDKTLDDDLKMESLQVLAEEYLSRTETGTFIRNRVFATVVPSGFDPSQAAQISQKAGLADISKWYHDLSYGNRIIAAVRDRWMKKLFSLDHFPESDMEVLDKFFTDKGIFADFVLPLIAHDYKALDNAIIAHSTTLSELNIGISPVLFLNELKAAIIESLGVKVNVVVDEDFEKISEEDDSYGLEEEGGFVEKFHKAIDEFTGKTKRKKRGLKGLKSRIARLRGFFDRDVSSLINWIKDKIQDRDIKGAESGILELIKNQDLNSDAHHLCKSLCDIATSFQKIRDFERSDLIAAKARHLNYKDSVPKTIAAENYRLQGKLRDALSKYEDVISEFPDDAFPRSGKAETLRQMGKLPEALQVYDETIKLFQNDEVARNGKAETLRQMGKLIEAHNVYEESIRLFSQNAYARSGKAETLRQMGKLLEALQVYDETIRLFQNDEVARNGKAETLRQMGKLPEALQVYDETIELFSDNVVARCGKAETLRQIGKLTEALQTYEETIGLFSDNVVARNGKAETLRQMGELTDALRTYEETIELFSDNVVARTGKAETLRQMSKLTEAFQTYEETIRLFNNYVFARNGKAETLRQMGELTDALRTYEETIGLFSDNLVARCGMAETLRQMGRLTEALQTYEETIRLFNNDVVAISGKAEILRQMGRLEDALSEYNQIIVDFPKDMVAHSARYMLLIQLNRDLNKVKKATEIISPASLDEWKILHIHCMLLLKMGETDKAIAYLKMGVENIEDRKSNDYYRGALSYAYILRKDFRNAISQIKGERTNTPIFEVLITHAYAEDKNLAEAKKHFNLIPQVTASKVVDISHFLSDRYHLNNIRFLGEKTVQELDSGIQRLEFELLTEPFLLVA